MESAFDVHNMIHYEGAKVANEVQEGVITVCIHSHTFLILPPTRVSPIGSGVTYDTAYVISIMYTPWLL